MAERPRILVLTGTEPTSEEVREPLPHDRELVVMPTLPEALAVLLTENFGGIYISSHDQELWQHAKVLLQNEAILEVLGEGVAIIQTDLRILWANATFEKWCAGPVQGRDFYEALAHPTVLGPDLDPLEMVLQGTCTQTRLQRHDTQYLDVRLAPLVDAEHKVRQIICLCRDVSSEVKKQQKLDAIHQAGRALACLQSDLSGAERIEVLKHNIRHLTHNLLNYDVIETRLLDARTGLLKPLLAWGMTPEAAARVLHAKIDGTASQGSSRLPDRPTSATTPLMILTIFKARTERAAR